MLRIKNLCRYFFVLAVAIIFAGGCATVAKVKTPKPAKYNMGATKTLVLAQMEGRRSIKEEIASILGKKARSSSWWRYEDRTSKGIEIKLKGDTATANPMPSLEELYLKIKAYELTAEKDEKKVSTGTNTYKNVVVYNGNCVLGVTSLDSKGRVKLAEKEFIGKSSVERDKGGDKSSAKNQALIATITQLINSITPKFVTENIEIDDKAEDLKPIIEFIKNKSYAVAAKKFEEKMAADPTRADVVYNLAALTDAMGNQKKALGLYDKAINLGGKSFYSKSRADCAKRIAAYEALSK